MAVCSAYIGNDAICPLHGRDPVGISSDGDDDIPFLNSINFGDIRDNTYPSSDSSRRSSNTSSQYQVTSLFYLFGYLLCHHFFLQLYNIFNFLRIHSLRTMLELPDDILLVNCKLTITIFIIRFAIPVVNFYQFIFLCQRYDLLIRKAELISYRFGGINPFCFSLFIVYHHSLLCTEVFLYDCPCIRINDPVIGSHLSTYNRFPQPPICLDENPRPSSGSVNGENNSSRFCINHLLHSN